MELFQQTNNYRDLTLLTVRRTVHTQHFTIVIQKATCFGCSRQPSCFTFRKHKKEIHIAAAKHTTVKEKLSQDLALT